MAILQRNIARKIGVSQMTISRALRGQPGMSEHTRLTILAAARKAGLPLAPSPKLARNVSLQHVICTLSGTTPAAPPSDNDSPFNPRLTQGLMRGAAECASEMASAPWSDTAAWPAMVTRKQVDGVVLICGNEHMFKCGAPCPVPQVNIFHGPPHADVVTVNNFRGGIRLGEYLAAMGHRRVAFIGPETEMARERLAGLRTGLETAGGACAPEVAQLMPMTGGQSPIHVNNLLGGETRPEVLRRRFTAIACYNDWFAVHAIRRLNGLGLRVPEDVSVTGFDNVMPLGYDGPKLATCAVPVEELGAEAARLVYWRIEHPNAIRRTLTLETELVAGETVQAVNSGQ